MPQCGMISRSQPSENALHLVQWPAETPGLQPDINPQIVDSRRPGTTWAQGMHVLRWAEPFFTYFNPVLRGGGGPHLAGGVTSQVHATRRGMIESSSTTVSP